MDNLRGLFEMFGLEVSVEKNVTKLEMLISETAVKESTVVQTVLELSMAETKLDSSTE